MGQGNATISQQVAGKHGRPPLAPNGPTDSWETHWCVLEAGRYPAGRERPLSDSPWESGGACPNRVVPLPSQDQPMVFVRLLACVGPCLDTSGRCFRCRVKRYRPSESAVPPLGSPKGRSRGPRHRSRANIGRARIPCALPGIEQSPSSRMRGLVRARLRLWFDDKA